MRDGGSTDGMEEAGKKLFVGPPYLVEGPEKGKMENGWPLMMRRSEGVRGHHFV